MKKLEMNQMSNLQGGGGCFGAMFAYGASIGGLHAAKNDTERGFALAGIASAFGAMVKACEQ